MRRPLNSSAALAYVQAWPEQPGVDTVTPGEHHWPILRRLFEATGAAGNLTADAHIAAMALEGGVAVYSCDRDFARFPG
jgi:predicted nucleic acid-binding protein